MQIYKISRDSTSSSILDFLRFLSAMTVFLYHFGFNLPGYQAVLVFFVLSGYFISSNILNSIQNDRWNWSEYLIKRMTRLWIVLIPALFLTFFWAKLQIYFFNDPTFFKGELDFKTFLGNIFFLQEILVQPYGLNGPLWSLSYEFWYYLLFPCLLLIFYSKSNIKRVLYCTLFFSISLFIGKKIFFYFFIWLLGALVPVIKPVFFKNKIIALSFLALSSFFVIFLIRNLYSFFPGPINLNHQNFLPDFCVGFSFAILIYFVTSASRNFTPLHEDSLSKKLSGFSYTLYLVHYPIYNFLATWILSSLSKTKIHYNLLIILVVLLTVIYSFLLAKITEKKTQMVTQKLIKWIK